MQIKTIVLSTFVALAAAETIQELVAQIPPCTKKCLDDASKQIGCDSSDNKCQCSKIDDLTSKSTPCIINCQSDDLSSTYQSISFPILLVAYANKRIDTGLPPNQSHLELRQPKGDPIC